MTYIFLYGLPLWTSCYDLVVKLSCGLHLTHIILLYRYDREEGNTMFDTTDDSSLFYGNDASYQKKEAELAKRLVCPLFSCYCSLIYRVISELYFG